MGREIRRVPLNWKHPKKNGKYIPRGERKFSNGETLGYQLYEVVSEGTPLSPVFENQEALISYLTTDKDFWGNKWSKKAVENLIKNNYAPSFRLVSYCYGVRSYAAHEA